jgi:hypothetical protein
MELFMFICTAKFNCSVRHSIEVNETYTLNMTHRTGTENLVGQSVKEKHAISVV